MNFIFILFFIFQFQLLISFHLTGNLFLLNYAFLSFLPTIVPHHSLCPNQIYQMYCLFVRRYQPFDGHLLMQNCYINNKYNIYCE